MYSRICFLLDNQKYYENYSKELLSTNTYDDKNTEFKIALSKLIKNFIKG